MTILHDLWLYIFRLAIANPMVVRVVSAGGKRVGHLWARFTYLAVLFVVMLIWGSSLLDTQVELANLAKNSTQIFMAVSLVQLVLMSFIAPVFTAGAITQERDGNTFDILLTTPLTSGQIVLGSLLSRLFFVWMMLLSGLPIFGITMIYGGVTAAEVFQSFGLAATTGLVTGAAAIMISMLRLGTRRTLFTFFFGIALYLLIVYALSLLPYFAVQNAPLRTGPSNALLSKQMSYLAPLHPFLALHVVTGLTPAPSASEVAPHSGLLAWSLMNPQYAYMLLTVVASIVMVVISLAFVRRGSKEGEATLLSRLTGLFKQRAPTGDRTQVPRRVWNNPIAWREAVTRGSAGGRSLVRWVFIIGGLIGAGVLLVLYNQGTLFAGIQPAAAAETMRAWLTVIVWIETVVILLVVTNTAAGTLTREKESQTVEILLATPLTSDYIIGGMLQGLVRFAVPLILVPSGTVLIFAIADMFRSANPVVTFEGALIVPLILIAFCAEAAVIGLQFSLTSRKTVKAAIISISIVLGASAVLWACGAAMLSSGRDIAAIVLPFTPLHAIQTAIDVQSLFDEPKNAVGNSLTQARIIRTISSAVAALVYLAITFTLYKNMVKGFDMIVRRQSR
jgi:ABC-type transport system involved in multi-copper enzyme maturation permease subunit